MSEKGKKILTIVLSCFLLVGIVGAAAALTKNFTEVPELIVDNTTEQIIHGGGSSEDSDDEPEEQPEQPVEPIEPGELSDVIACKLTIFYNSENGSGGTSKELSESSDFNTVYYDIKARDSFTKFGIYFEYVLNTGSVKKYNFGLEGTSTRNYKGITELPESLSNYLIVVEKDGNEPIDFVSNSEYQPDSGFNKLATYSTEIGAKIFVYGSLEKSLESTKITISYNGSSQQQTRFVGDEDEFFRFSYPVSDPGSFVVDMTIRRTFDDETYIDNEYNDFVILSSIPDCDSVILVFYYDYEEQSPRMDEEDIYVDGFDLADTNPGREFRIHCDIFKTFNDDPGEESYPYYSGYYRIALTRNEIIRLNNNGVIRLITPDPLEEQHHHEGDTRFKLISVSTIIDDKYYDSWYAARYRDINYGTSLEIHQDGSSLETQITGFNDTSIGGEWYIDGHITPPEVNYTLEIIIYFDYADNIGYSATFTDEFLTHNTHIINHSSYDYDILCSEGLDCEDSHLINSLHFDTNVEYVINPNITAIDIGRVTKKDCITFRVRDKATMEILDEKESLDSFEVVGNDVIKHIQCKENGSNVVTETEFTFDEYKNANFFVTIEFSNNYDGSGYQQNFVFNNILGKIASEEIYMD